jgi:hypothetical protein
VTDVVPGVAQRAQDLGEHPGVGHRHRWDHLPAASFQVDEQGQPVIRPPATGEGRTSSAVGSLARPLAAHGGSIWLRPAGFEALNCHVDGALVAAGG